MDAPWLRLYTRDGDPRGDIPAPAKVRGVIRAYAASTLEIDLQPGDPREEILRAEGTRVEVTLAGEHLAGGPVTRWTLEGPVAPRMTVTVTDDRDILRRIMVAPRPDQGLDAQGSDAEWAGTGPLESVLKTLAAANAPRAGVVMDIAPDLGRGPQVTVRGRWVPIEQVLEEHLRAARMVVTVRWVPQSRRLLLDVTEPGTYHTRLSAGDGTVQQWRVTSSAPAVTRALIGTTSGGVTQVIQGGVEAAWGITGEGYRSASTAPEAESAALALLEEHGPASGMAVTLAESPHVHYGGPHGLRVGQRVRLQVGAVTITDTLTECEVEWGPDSAPVARPKVGAWDDSPVTSLTRAVAAIARTIRRA